MSLVNEYDFLGGLQFLWNLSLVVLFGFFVLVWNFCFHDNLNKHNLIGTWGESPAQKGDGELLHTSIPLFLAT